MTIAPHYHGTDGAPRCACWASCPRWFWGWLEHADLLRALRRAAARPWYRWRWQSIPSTHTLRSHPWACTSARRPNRPGQPPAPVPPGRARTTPHQVDAGRSSSVACGVSRPRLFGRTTPRASGSAGGAWAANPPSWSHYGRTKRERVLNKSRF